MPEYKKGPFNLLPNPPYEELALHSEVFQIWPSGEIFTNYEQYADRLYQYNEKEWSCRYTGKSNLTFAEAFASEEKARKALDSFPEAWKGPLLAFIQHSMASLDQICNQFMDYIKVNYIPGEDIKIDFDGRKMHGKIISSNPHENDVFYRVEIFEDEDCNLLVGEANIFGSGSFSRERQYLNKTMIKRYAKSVANRRGPNFPWFLSDELAQKYGISTELPVGISDDMKPNPIKSKSSKQNNSRSQQQMPIDEYFLNSSAGFLAEERSVSPPPPQFTFPCDDAVVPAELIDPDLKYPDLVPINQLISDSDLLSRSISIWTFCQTFSAQLKLSPFSYDDWEEALTCLDIDSNNPVIEETFLALLSTLMKDRRNLTKGVFADKLKSAVLTFKPEISGIETTNTNDIDDSGDNDNVEDDGPEIVISSDDDEEEEEGLFVKRSRKKGGAHVMKKTKSLLLPSIDLRKHRWYETRSMENWHFVLGSFYLDLIDMISQFISEEESKESDDDSEEEGSSADENTEDDPDTGNDSAYEDVNDKIKGDDKAGSSSESDNEADSSVVSLKQLSVVESPLETMRSFIKIYESITDELTLKGSKEMISTYLNLSLSSKLSLLEFLVHFHYERENFKSFVEECLERQGEARRLRKEIEIEARQVFDEVEKLEGEVSRLKEENLSITERLEADESDIEMSEGEEEDEEEGENKGKEPKQEEGKGECLNEKINDVQPLTEKERDELIDKRNVNKKEISSLNVQLRKLRPEAAAYHRKCDAVNRDLRKCSSFRTFSLGQDRLFREYWWFGDFINPLGRLLIFDSLNKTWIGSIEKREEVEKLMEWLNPLGINEAKLKAALIEIENDVKMYLNERELPENEPVAKPDNSDSEEVDFEALRRGRGRPPKGSNPSISNSFIQKRPFQRYKNTMS